METDLKKSKHFDKRLLVILGVMLVIVGIFSTIYSLRKEVVIKDGKKEIKTTAYICTVGNLLKKENIILNRQDQVSKPLDAKIKKDMKIIIKRAHPVIIHADGGKKEVMTANAKVKDILKEHHIILAKMDKVFPGLEEKVAKNGQIYIARIKEEFTVEKVTLPYESVIKYNDNLAEGKINVLQSGQNGEKEVKYRILYKDGKEIAREFVEENIFTPAQNEVVEKGTAKFVATSRGAVRAKGAFVMTATAYDSSFQSCGKRPGDSGYGITRSGTRVRPGVVAVDPKVIPLGTNLYIKALDGSSDYGFARAEDTGGAIKGSKIDLYYDNSRDAKKFGKKKVQVFILD